MADYEYTAEELQAELEARANKKEIAPGVQAGNVGAASELVSGYPERVWNALTQRWEETKQAAGRYLAGEQSGPETALQIAGKGIAGSVADVVGETVSTGIGAASDMINPNIRKGFNDLMQNVTDSQAAQQALEYYMGLDEKNRANIESVFNISSIMAPWKTKMVKTAEGAERAALVSKPKALKAQMLERMLHPPRTEANIKAELLNGGVDVKDMVNDIIDIKGFSPLKNPLGNIDALNKHADMLENKLQETLAVFDKSGVMRNARNPFAASVLETIKTSPNVRAMGLKSKQASNIFESIMRKYDGIAKNLKDEGVNPNSLRGLLETRRAFDKHLAKEFAALERAGGGTAMLAAEKQVIMDMRKQLNEVVGGFVDQFESADESVKELLKKQRSTIIAKENYAQTVAKAEQDITEKGWFTRAISSHPFLVYRTLQNNAKTSPILAGVLAAPSAINTLGEAYGAGRRALAQPRVPLVRAGMMYGGEDTQQEQ